MGSHSCSSKSVERLSPCSGVALWKQDLLKSKMGVIMIIMLVLLGLVSLIFLLKPKMKQFHVKMDPMEMEMMGFDMFPIIHFFMSVMPDSMRKKSVTKKNAPKPGVNIPRDRYDLTGETPYKIEEMKPGKIGQVTYDMENLGVSNSEAKKQAKSFGMNPADEKYQEKCLKSAALLGEGVAEVVRKDLETAKYWYGKDDITDEEILKSGPKSLKVFVVKLNNGSLLLYAPVRIRNEVGFGDWLDSLGPVEWLVVASSYHTLNIQAAAEQYPDAKIIGAPAAEDKLNFVNALVRMKFDYNCTDQADLKTVNSKLEKEGVTLHYVEGDIGTNAIVAIAHNVALECDLVYTHHDGEGMFHISKDQFRKFLPEDWTYRLFKFAMISKPNSPHGFLPNYRYQMMDPNSFGALSYDQPAFDGSTCKIMANSLRKIQKLQFESALGVHISLQTAEEFKKNIDANWSWLDGKSLS